MSITAQISLPLDQQYLAASAQVDSQAAKKTKPAKKRSRQKLLPFDDRFLATACKASVGVDSQGRVIVVVDAAGRKELSDTKTGDVFAVELDGNWFDALMGSKGTFFVKAPAEVVNSNAVSVHIKRRYVEPVQGMSNAGAMTADVGTQAERLPMTLEPFKVTDEGFPGRHVCRDEQRPCARSKCPYWLYRQPGETLPGRPGLSQVKRDALGKTKRIIGQIEQQEDKQDAIEPGWLFGRPSCELDFHEQHNGKPATTDEIAETLGRSPSWVRKVQRAGLQKLAARGISEEAIKAALKSGK